MEILNNGLFVNNNIVSPKRDVQKIPTAGNSFQDILKKRVDDKIQFSKHANVRLGDRSINLSKTQMERVQGGVDMAKEKGLKSSLVLVDDVALVVSVKNNVVITATKNDNKNIFTNIDGAVIV